MKKLLLALLFLPFFAASQRYVLENKDTLLIAEGDSVGMVTQTVAVPVLFKVKYPVILSYKNPTTTPPVVIPPVSTAGLIRYMDWAKTFVYGKIIAAKIGKGYYNTQSIKGDVTNAIFPGTTMPALKISWKWPDYISSSYRAEVQSDGNDAINGDDNYYGFAFYAETWEPSRTWGQSILQWHDNNQNCPPLGLQISENNEVQVAVCIGGGTQRFGIGAFRVGVREDYVLHVLWSTDAKKGIVEVWRNGDKVFSRTGIQTMPSGGGYNKIGLNYWGATSESTPRVAYYGPFKVGKSYSEVKP